jgi:cytochrome c-type biogenesis protein CcmH
MSAGQTLWQARPGALPLDQTPFHWGARPMKWGLGSPDPSGGSGAKPPTFLAKALTLAFLLYLAHPLPAFAVSDPAEMLPNHAEELRAEQIGGQLRCLVCQNETIEDSDADLARDLRKIVRQHVAAGETNKQVIAWMTARYGDFVRLRPPFQPLTYVLWLSPLIAVSVGIGAAVLARQRRTTPPPPLSEAERARLRTLLNS